MRKIKIHEKIKESESKLFNSMLSKFLILLKIDFSTDNDFLRFSKGNDISVFSRLILTNELSEKFEITTVTGMIRDHSYNITSLIKVSENENLDLFTDFTFSTPFFVKKIFIYGQLCEFQHVYSDFSYGHLNDNSIEKEAIVDIDTEDILLFENEDGKQFMIWTPESPSFEVIFNKIRIDDILNKKYSMIDEKVYKIKRVVE